MTRLRTARTARGWSQAQLIHALSREAAADGMRLPAHESMRIMLSRWENGHVQPDETYRRYLCAVFDSGAGALGLRSSKQLTTAGLALPTPEVSATLIGHLQRTFDELARTDNQLGAAACLRSPSRRPTCCQPLPARPAERFATTSSLWVADTPSSVDGFARMRGTLRLPSAGRIARWTMRRNSATPTSSPTCS